MKAKTYFDALGRSAQAKGQRVIRPMPETWPLFAKQAFLYGYLKNAQRIAIRARGTQ